MPPAAAPPVAEDSTLLGRLRELPAPVWVLATGQFINKFGAFVLFFLIIYLTRLGYSPAQAGLAASAYGAGGFFAMFAGGWTADHVGRRATIVFSMFSSAATMLVFSQATGLLALTALAGLAGFCAELYRPAASALLADLTPPGRRITVFAVYRTAINAGIALGPAVAGFLAERSFLWLFIGDAMTSAVFGFVAVFALPRTGAGAMSAAPAASAAEEPGTVPGEPTPMSPTSADPRRTLWSALRADRPLQGVLVGMFGGVFVLFQIAVVLPLHVTALGFSTATYGMLLSLNGFMIATIEIPATSIMIRFPARLTIAAGFLLIGLAFGFVGLSATITLLVMAIAVATIGEILAMPVAGAFVADLAPDYMRGRYQGLLGAAAALGVAAAPAAGGALYGWAPPAAFTSFALVGAVAASAVLWGARSAAPAAPAAQIHPARPGNRMRT